MKLSEVKYYRQKLRGGWDPETKQTDPSLSPTERGRVAGYISNTGTSLDWNDRTDEYNPYPLRSNEFRKYEDAFDKATEDMRQRYPHI